MKKLFPLLLIPVALVGIAATYTITQLTANLNPGNSTLIEVYDPAATPKSGKVLLTNYVKQAQIDTSAEIQAILGSVYQATNGVLTRVAGIGLGTSGDVLFRDAAGWTNLAKGDDGEVLKLNSGFPSWQPDQTGGGGALVGTVLNPNVPVIAGEIAMFADTSGTNLASAVANLQYIAPWANAELTTLNTDGLVVTNSTELRGGADVTGTLTVSGDVNITGNMTNSTTQTDTLYLSSLTETNKVIGIGATTNAMVATAAMVTNTLGIDFNATLALKAPLASPALTGDPTAPTPAENDNDTSIATTAYVQTEIAGIAGGSPTTNIVMSALGTTPSFAFGVTNSTAAAAGAQQVSPAIHWSGNGWKTTATAASREVGWRAYVLPVEGSSNPSSEWNLQNNVNDGAFTTQFKVGSTGASTFTGNIVGQGSALIDLDIRAGTSQKIYFNSRSQMTSPANGTIRFLDSAGTAISAVQASRVVSTETTSDNALVTESVSVYVNTGAGGAVTMTLPTWAAGITYTFVVETAQNFIVDAPGTDTIRIAATESAAGGNVTSNTIGNAITIVATSSGKWVAISTVGTWTVN